MVGGGTLDHLAVVFRDLSEVNPYATEGGFLIEIEVGRPDFFGREFQDHPVIPLGYQDKLVIEIRRLGTSDKGAAQAEIPNRAVHLAVHRHDHCRPLSGSSRARPIFNPWRQWRSPLGVAVRFGTGR